LNISQQSNRLKGGYIDSINYSITNLMKTKDIIFDSIPSELLREKTGKLKIFLQNSFSNHILKNIIVLYINFIFKI